MSDTIKKLREALTRISELTPSAANTATARDLHLTIRAIADTALADVATPSAEPSEQKLIDIANVVEGRLEDRLAKVLGVKQYPSASSLDFDELLEIVEDRLANRSDSSEQKAVAWERLREAYEAAKYVPGDSPVMPYKAAAFMRTVGDLLASPPPAGDRGSVNVKAGAEGEIGELLERLDRAEKNAKETLDWLANRDDSDCSPVWEMQGEYTEDAQAIRQAVTCLTTLSAKLADAISTVRLLQDQYKRQSDHDTALIETAERKLEEARKALRNLTARTENFWALIQGEHGVSLSSEEQDDHNVFEFFSALEDANTLLSALTTEGANHD